MTEEEWLSANDCNTLSEVLSNRASIRKWRLFVCHVVQNTITSYDGQRFQSLCRSALSVAESAVEGSTPDSSVDASLESVYRALRSLDTFAPGFVVEFRVLNLAAFTCDPSPDSTLARVLPNWGAGNETIPGLLRDIFGNPFRPVSFDPRWRTSDALGLARAIYDDRAFDRLPILADALMDAGCADEQIIAHCRGDGPHVRGCWVVDLILGKE